MSNPEVWGWDIVKAFRLRVVEDFRPFVGFSAVWPGLCSGAILSIRGGAPF